MLLSNIFNRTRANSFHLTNIQQHLAYFSFQIFNWSKHYKTFIFNPFLSTAAITLLTVYSLLVNAPNSTNEPALSQIIDIICELLAKNCS